MDDYVVSSIFLFLIHNNTSPSFQLHFPNHICRIIIVIVIVVSVTIFCTQGKMVWYDIITMVIVEQSYLH